MCAYDSIAIIRKSIILNKLNHMVIVMIACIGIMTDDNGTENIVRIQMYGDDFLFTGFTERSLELAIMRLYDVMESLQSEHLNRSDERAIRFH